MKKWYVVMTIRNVYRPNQSDKQNVMAENVTK